MSEHVSYWLTAAEPDKAYWTEIVRSLATRFDAPIFEPHVTLYSGPLSSSERPDEIIHAATRETSEIVLNTTGIGHTEQFTKTLFVEFATNEAIVKISDELKRHSALPGDYELKLHLSLIYATLAPDVANRLGRELSVPSRVRFGTVKAMVSRGLTRAHANVEEWRIVASVGLSSSGRR
jgi:hypothetical protein